MDWAEENLCDYKNLDELCDVCWFQRPIRAYAPEPEIMRRFLDRMRISWDVEESIFSQLMIGHEGRFKDWHEVKGDR